MSNRHSHRFITLPALFGLLLLLAGCEQWFKPEPPRLVLKPARFADLPGWRQDELQDWAQAFQRSCTRIARRPTGSTFGVLRDAGTIGDWQPICTAFSALPDRTSPTLRTFVETHFRPWQVTASGETQGLFTGYYEASLRGSRTRQSPYDTPLHRRPADLVMVNLGEFRPELKGTRIAGRVRDGILRPYEERRQIIAGQWPHAEQVLVWVDDPIDAFFVQIQGSGVVELDDGSLLRIGYDGQNGHPYFAIGRELIRREALTPETVSMQSIRAWLEQNPEQADEVMNRNPSYVFFREITGDGPIGGEGVALTPGRSLAVDSSLLSYGLPMWVDIAPPVDGEAALRRLMMAQDTGGAIRGPVRGDVFWGFGPDAEYRAGHMKSSGRYWVLLPAAIESLASAKGASHAGF